MTLNKPIILIIIIIIIIIVIIVVAVTKNLLGYSSEEVILRIIICANALVSNFGFSKMTSCGVWCHVVWWHYLVTLTAVKTSNLAHFITQLRGVWPFIDNTLSILIKLKFIKQYFNSFLNAVRYKRKIIFVLHLIRFLYNIHWDINFISYNMICDELTIIEFKVNVYNG